MDGAIPTPTRLRLPGAGQAVVIEVPADQTAASIAKDANAGIKHVWIHQGTKTPEALAIGKNEGLQVRHGSRRCDVSSWRAP
jgi:hypothetical protein